MPTREFPTTKQFDAMLAPTVFLSSINWPRNLPMPAPPPTRQQRRDKQLGIPSNIDDVVPHATLSTVMMAEADARARAASRVEHKPVQLTVPQVHGLFGERLGPLHELMAAAQRDSDWKQRFQVAVQRCEGLRVQAATPRHSSRDADENGPNLGGAVQHTHVISHATDVAANFRRRQERGNCVVPLKLESRALTEHAVWNAASTSDTGGVAPMHLEHVPVTFFVSNDESLDSKRAGDDGMSKISNMRQLYEYCGVEPRDPAGRLEQDMRTRVAKDPVLASRPLSSLGLPLWMDSDASGQRAGNDGSFSAANAPELRQAQSDLWDRHSAALTLKLQQLDAQFAADCQQLPRNDEAAYAKLLAAHEKQRRDAENQFEKAFNSELKDVNDSSQAATSYSPERARQQADLWRNYIRVLTDALLQMDTKFVADCESARPTEAEYERQRAAHLQARLDIEKKWRRDVRKDLEDRKEIGTARPSDAVVQLLNRQDRQILDRLWLQPESLEAKLHGGADADGDVDMSAPRNDTSVSPCAAYHHNKRLEQQSSVATAQQSVSTSEFACQGCRRNPFDHGETRVFYCASCNVQLCRRCWPLTRFRLRDETAISTTTREADTYPGMSDAFVWQALREHANPLQRLRELVTTQKVVLSDTTRLMMDSARFVELATRNRSSTSDDAANLQAGEMRQMLADLVKSEQQSTINAPAVPELFAPVRTNPKDLSFVYHFS